MRFQNNSKTSEGLKQQKLDRFMHDMIPAILEQDDKSQVNRSSISKLHSCKNYNMQHNDWHMPATKDPHSKCGTFIPAKHPLSLPPCKEKPAKILKEYPQWCYRASCSVCYKKWSNRLANRAVKKIHASSRYKKGCALIHLLASPPKRQYIVPDKNLIRKMNRILKEARITGAVVIHAFRKVGGESLIQYSPHFHIVGFGWYRDLKVAAKKHGWHAAYFGERKAPVFYTFRYLLSHCGIKKGYEAIRWVGKE